MGSSGCGQAMIWEVLGLAKPDYERYLVWPSQAMEIFGIGQAMLWEVLDLARPRHGKFGVGPGRDMGSSGCGQARPRSKAEIPVQGFFKVFFVFRAQ